MASYQYKADGITIKIKDFYYFKKNKTYKEDLKDIKNFFLKKNKEYVDYITKKNDDTPNGGKISKRSIDAIRSMGNKTIKECFDIFDLFIINEFVIKKVKTGEITEYITIMRNLINEEIKSGFTKYSISAEKKACEYMKKNPYDPAYPDKLPKTKK